jgi:hypothetical protein
MEIFEDFPPIAFIAGATPMTFINNDQIKEIWAVFTIKTGSPLILGD